MRRLILITSALITLAMSTRAQLSGEWVQDNLATECSAITYLVAGDLDFSLPIEQMSDHLLQRAGIPRTESDPGTMGDAYLIVSKDVVAGALHVMTTFYRRIADTGYGKPGMVVVWSSQSLVPDFQQPFTIATEQLNQFITEYLRANPECDEISD